MRYVIACHGEMASGIKKTIEMLIGKRENLYCLTAYVNSQDFHTEVKQLLDSFPPDEMIYVFTDIFGGSVNQTILPFLNCYKIQLISGMNLPLILDFILRDAELSDEEIDKEIKQAQNQIIHVNKI